MRKRNILPLLFSCLCNGFCLLAYICWISHFTCSGGNGLVRLITDDAIPRHVRERTFSLVSCALFFFLLVVWYLNACKQNLVIKAWKVPTSPAATHSHHVQAQRQCPCTYLSIFSFLYYHVLPQLFWPALFGDSSRWYSTYCVHSLFLIYLEDAATLALVFARDVDGIFLHLGFHEWQVARNLLVSHQGESSDNAKPVQVVRDDRTICGAIGPSEDSIKDTPATATA